MTVSTTHAWYLVSVQNTVFKISITVAITVTIEEVKNLNRWQRAEAGYELLDCL